MSFDLVRARRRLVIMAAIDVVALVAAVVCAVGYFGYGVAPMLWLFAAALTVGMAAQVWFIAGLRRADKGV